MKIPLKTDKDIEIMRQGGKITTEALRAVKNATRPGITPLELDAIAEKTIISLGAEPSFKKVPGYTHTLCTCINDVVVHGKPDDTPLVAGDILGIDVGAYYKGFHTDLSYSVIVTEDGFWEPTLEDVSAFRDSFNRHDPIPSLSSPETPTMDEKKRFLIVGMCALIDAIPQARIGGYIGDIASVLQKYLEGCSYSVVRELIGHGVGRDLHEPPQVPGRGRPGEGIVLKQGMVLAIEAIYTMGKPGVAYKNKDGWSIATADYSLSGLYEQTVAVTSSGGEVLTFW